VTERDAPPTLPQHIQETVRAIALLHAQHHGDATRLQRWTDRATALLGSPKFIGLLILLVAAWVGANVLMSRLGFRAIDPPPFPLLSGMVSLASLIMVVLVLSTQRREDKLAQLREQLTLELAILSEQKTAKVIQLLEESRRDNPMIHNRVDHEADAMARPSDPHSVLNAIRHTHAEAEKAGGPPDPGG
jgi:uncharacterized membrane protein